MNRKYRIFNQHIASLNDRQRAFATNGIYDVRYILNNAHEAYRQYCESTKSIKGFLLSYIPGTEERSVKIRCSEALDAGIKQLKLLKTICLEQAAAPRERQAVTIIIDDPVVDDEFYESPLLRHKNKCKEETVKIADDIHIGKRFNH